MNRKRKTEVIYTNRKAYHNYEVLEKFEAGIVLEGPEVKSIKQKQVNLSQSFARAEKNGIFLYGMRVSPYACNTIKEIDPDRTRKLLLKKREIKKMAGAAKRKGVSLVPLEIYLKNGWVKLTLAMARGRKTYDKSEIIKKRDLDRQMKREMKERF